MKKNLNIGQYLAKRLEQVGLKDYFVVPGDYNLLLLDQILTNKKLRMISCCNELNAGYAADGYARATGGLSAMFVTYSVGGLSAINAVAGAYAENLPLIIISGSPNTNAIHNNQLLHHTLGTLDFDYVSQMYKHITADVQVIRHIKDAPYQIDKAIKTALEKRKPVYVEIPCNIPKEMVSSAPLSELHIKDCDYNKARMDLAVKHAAELLNKAKRPVLVAGPHLQAWNAVSLFDKLAKKAGYAVASMPDAKGLFSETDSQYIGIYWGPVSWPQCNKIVESADAYLFAGPSFTDYTTTGYQMKIDDKKLVLVEKHKIIVSGQMYPDLDPDVFLHDLTKKLKKNSLSLKNYTPSPPKALSKKYKITDKLTREYLFSKIQKMLTKNNAVLAETGDSWFNGVDLHLPKGCPFAIQMTYGSIGWSVGALLGYQLALNDKKRVIACIGDGSFQLSAQEISTMLRYKLKPIIFLMNNGSYAIEVEIHDGPYNVINDWKYASIVETLNVKKSNAWGCSVKTVTELDTAITKALKTNTLCFIEVHIAGNDCNPNLLKWGKHVAKANGTPYKVPTGYNQL
jgi:pyruvate decarboxylase